MNADIIIDNLKNENTNLQKEIYELKKQNLSLEEYNQKISRLVRVFRNEYAIMQTKCIQTIENEDPNKTIIGFNDFLKGKVHTIAEVLNDLQIILSLKINIPECEESEESEKQ